MKTALFGGTFNPVHIGHLLIAEEVLLQAGYDRIVFIPANIPPHKEVEDPGPEIRLSMLKDSVAGNPSFCVSDCEIRRSGISYSIDTIRYLVEGGIVERCPGLVVGDDLVEGLDSWKDSGAVVRESRIVIVHRKYLEELSVPFSHLYLSNDIFPVSSTVIRSRIGEGRAWRYMVPEAARKTIEENGLYGFSRY